MATASNNRPRQRQPRHVLISRFSAIGDVAMTVPVIYSACRCYPDTTFYLVTRPSMTQIFVNAPANLKLIGVDVKNEYVGVRGMRRLLKQLRAQAPIDAFIDLHAVIRTMALATFARLHGIRTTSIHKGRRGKRALTRRHNKVMLPLVSQRSRYREAFYRAGLPITERFDGLFGSDRAAPSTFAEITAPKESQPGARWIGIAPFSIHRGKIYPIDMMKQVVDTLAAIPGVKIFLFGGGDDESRVFAQWSEGRENVVSLAQKRYGFPVELALMSHMDVMLSMDSANMHLASLVNIPVVSVWGATHSYCGYKGWHQLDSNTVQLPMPCRPCSVFGNKPCHRGDYYCLAGIAPSTIVDKIKKFI